jgi:hypothetical protein
MARDVHALARNASSSQTNAYSLAESHSADAILQTLVHSVADKVSKKFLELAVNGSQFSRFLAVGFARIAV